MFRKSIFPEGALIARGPDRLLQIWQNPFLTLARGLFLTLVLSLGGLLPAPVSAATQNNIFPVTLLVFVPCVNGGAGEDVELKGNLHLLLHDSLNPNGGVHFTGQTNAQGVIGTGLTTGTKYQAPGVNLFKFNANVGEQVTAIANFLFIGPGPRNNFLVHVNLHVTVNANGVVTSSFENFSTECK